MSTFHSTRNVVLCGPIVDFVSLDCLDGVGGELGILTVRDTASGEFRTSYACGDSLRNALSLFYPDGQWQGQTVQVTLEMSCIVCLERLL